MDFVKRYPILTAILALCVAAFAAESFFLWSFNKSVSIADRNLRSARTDADKAEHQPVAPSADNLDAAKSNAAALQAVLDTVKTTFPEHPDPNHRHPQRPG